MEQNDISSRIVFADRGKVNVEKGVEFAPKFDQNGLIPALAIDHITHEPLMLAYMNAESLRMTMELGEAVYYSRSRQDCENGFRQGIHTFQGRRQKLHGERWRTQEEGGCRRLITEP